MWRRSRRRSVRLLAVQGVALAALVAALGIAGGDAELWSWSPASSVLVKAAALPAGSLRTASAGRRDEREAAPRVNPRRRCCCGRC